MKITDVRGFLLSDPMPEPIVMEYYGGIRTIFKRDAAFLKVTTDSGLTGYGPAPASHQTVDVINGVIRTALIGSDPLQIDALWSAAQQAADTDITHAFGAVEIALYDLRGKFEGCPVHELLGGAVRDRIRLYGSAGMYQPAEEYAREAAAVAALGFSAYKMRPALGPEEDLRTVELVRQAVGPDVGICLDSHVWWRMGERSYSATAIEQLARDAAPYGITWLEEPIPPEERQAYVELRQQRIVPIAAGEHEASLSGFLEIVKGGAVDIAQADASHHGGFKTVKPVLEACVEHGIEFAFHNWGTLLECICNAHLGVCFEANTCSWLEYPCYRHRGQDIMYPYQLADDLLRDPLDIRHGDLVLSDGPGLGVSVDESVVERYPFLPGPWSTFRLHGTTQELAMSADHVQKWEKK